MANQQGKRSQNDLNAPQNKAQKQSIQSTDQAQHMGDTEQSRSVQSGVSGIPSQMHVGADRGAQLEKNIDKRLGKDDDGDQSGNYRTGASEKGPNRTSSNANSGDE